MTPILPTLAVPLSITAPSDVLDMPVDPNEPTYCLCHQVSYGEMIGCDNPDVSTSNFPLEKVLQVVRADYKFMVTVNDDRNCPLEEPNS